MYRLHRRLTKRLYVLSFAFGLLLCEMGLLIHQVEHNLSLLSEKVCYLCDAANQIGSALISEPPVNLPTTVHEINIPQFVSIYSQQTTVAYSSRAPPFIPSV